MNHFIESAIQELRHPDQSTRLAATAYLRDNPHAAAIEPLVDALSDGSIDVAYGAAEALLQLGDAVEPTLLDSFGTVQDDSTLYLLLVTLASVATPASESVLIDALNSGNEHYTEVAIEGLRHINTPNARAALQEFGA